MRKTQSVEIVGIGEVEIFPLKAAETKAIPLSKDGKSLIKVPAKKVESEGGYFVDSNGTKYSETDVFYKFGENEPIQRIKRTDKVKKYEVADKTAWTDLADDVGTSVLNCSETTKENFKAKVGDGSIKFKIKKADRGFKFYKAFAYLDGEDLKMKTGRGSEKEGLEEFHKLAKESGKQGIKQDLVEVSADEIEIEV